MAKNGEILNTLKVTRSVRDVVEKYATQRRTLMIVIVARRVTTHIIGKPRGSFVGAKKEFIFVEDAGYATVLPRSLFLTLLFTYTCYCADAEEEEKHPLIVVRAIYCQKNKT